MEMTEEELHIFIHAAIDDCIEHYLLYKAFYSFSKKTIILEEMELLNRTLNAHIQICYMIWCKVFGSMQRTHYENLVKKEDFLEKIEMDYSISAKEFEEYVNQVKKFRNKYIAHTEIAELIVPEFDIALKAIITLDKILEANAYDVPFGTIEDYCNEAGNKYQDLVVKLIG